MCERHVVRKMERFIYFAGSIRGGRKDVVLYARIVELLKGYGTVFTEHVGDLNLTEAGKALASSQAVFLAHATRLVRHMLAWGSPWGSPPHR